MAPDPFDDPRLTAMGLLIEVHDGLTRKLDPVFAAHGLSGSDFDLLIRMVRSPRRGLRMTDLAAQTCLSTSGITRVMDRLERSGLAGRQACEGDRRSTFAVITDAGRERLAALLPDLLDAINTWFTGRLTPERLDALLADLRTLRAAAHPGATAGVPPPEAQAAQAAQA